MSKRISQLNQITRAQLAVGDLIPVVDISAGQTKYATLSDLTGLPDFGWTATGETHTYSSWSSTYKIGVITVPTDATIKYTPGMRYRISQSTGGTKYGIIVAVTSTTLTVYFGTDYTLNNETISSPVYSAEKSPVGFPGDPRKWTQRVTDTVTRTQTSPTAGTWYNPGTTNNQIAAPVGLWKSRWQAAFGGYRNAAVTTIQFMCTLSTANNSESDAEQTAWCSQEGASALLAIRQTGNREKTISIASNQTLYLNVKALTAASDEVSTYGLQCPTIIELECAYL